MNTLSVLVEALFAEPAWFSVIGLGLDVVAVAAITWDLVISGRPVDRAGNARSCWRYGRRGGAGHPRPPQAREVDGALRRRSRRRIPDADVRRLAALGCGRGRAKGGGLVELMAAGDRDGQATWIRVMKAEDEVPAKSRPCANFWARQRGLGARIGLRHPRRLSHRIGPRLRPASRWCRRRRPRARCRAGRGLRGCGPRPRNPGRRGPRRASRSGRRSRPRRPRRRR